MQNNADNQNKKVAASAADKTPQAPSQDMVWKRFDAMLQEFLKMEQTSPSVRPRETARTP
jgi:hypothetical protein